MKRIVLFAAACLVSLMAVAQVSFGKADKFDDDWLFSQSDDKEASRPSFDDSAWRRLSLPHDWSIEGQLSREWASCTGYLPAGVAWYRKHFDLTSISDKTYIYFEGIYNRSEVYLNGHLLGKRPNGYVSFMYDMTPYLRQRGNVLAVRVDHSRYADSRWYTGSGIYRDVWLVRARDTHLSQWGLTYRLAELRDDGSAKVEVDVAVDADGNDAKGLQARLSFKDDKGKEVADGTFPLNPGMKKGERQTFVLTVPQAHLWNLNAPCLYTLDVTLLDAKGTFLDEASCRAGLRTLRFDANKGFALNGQWMKVKGVCIHHDAGVLGAAVPREVWVRKVTELKRMGANAIRMSHNPQAPMLYDICDELGMLVMDEGSDEWEFPKRKWVEGWNQGTPSFDGSFDFFEEWIDRDVADMVRRDRNHPCVFLWSVGNEVDYPNDPYSHPVLDGNNAAINQPMFGGYKEDAPRAERIGTIAKRIAAVIRSIDTSRPVTGALAGVVMSNETDYPEAIDVVGYNYTENRYKEDHEKYPQRIIYGSETGSGLDAWKAVMDNDHIFGQFIWTGTDYLGESGRWPSRGLNTGLLDFGSFRKPRGWLRASLWSEPPVTYIGTYPLMRASEDRRGGQRDNQLSQDAQDDWNWDDFKPWGNWRPQRDEQGNALYRVVCYTNAPQARLTLNGEQVGEMKRHDSALDIIHWDIPFQPGTLRAEGLDEDGNVVSSYDIATHGQPAAIRVTQLEPSGTDLCQLLVEVVDQDGHRVKAADSDITCTIQGNAVLLGLEGSNNADMSDYRDNHQPAFRGRLLAYVRRQSGPVSLTFSAEGLSSSTFMIR